jgi:hypothetical protein
VNNFGFISASSHNAASSIFVEEQKSFASDIGLCEWASRVPNRLPNERGAPYLIVLIARRCHSQSLLVGPLELIPFIRIVEWGLCEGIVMINHEDRKNGRARRPFLLPGPMWRPAQKP